MKLNKKLSLILASVITSSTILLSSFTVAHAKASAIIVATKDGSTYEYSYTDLKTSAVASITGDTANAALYNHFLLNKTSITAYFDDVRNVYVPMSAVSAKATEAVLSGTTFDFKGFMESSTTPTTTITPTKVQNNNGVITPAGVQDSTSTDFDVISVD